MSDDNEGDPVEPVTPQAALIRFLESVKNVPPNLEVLTYCLKAAIKYIENEPLAGRQDLARPLNQLLFALRDLGLGAKTPLLEPQNKPNNRPRGKSGIAQKGFFVAAVKILRENGMRNSDAVLFVIKESKALKLDTPSVIELKRWVGDSGGNLPQIADDIAEQILRDYKTEAQPKDIQNNLGSAKKFVAEIMIARRDAGFG